MRERNDPLRVTRHGSRNATGCSRGQTKQTKETTITMEPLILDEFRQGLTQIKTGVQNTQNEITDLCASLTQVQREHEQTRAELDKLRKAQLAGVGRPILRANQVVSEACARH